MEIVTAAAGIVGKALAQPLSDAAQRRERVLRGLKALKLDGKVPRQDFDHLYARALIEYCSDRAPAVLAFFRDEHVQAAFQRSFSRADDWARLRDEAAEALARNRETGEFGHFDHGFEEHLDGFVTTFHELVDRSRAPHETRLEQKVDALAAEIGRIRDEEENHRARTEPGRAELTPAQRLMEDVREWFGAVGYEVRRVWEVPGGHVAMLVDIPQRRPGRFDRTVMLCVEDELAPYQLRLLSELVKEEGAAEGWGLARLRVSEAARRRAADSGDVLFCYSFDELIDLEADFDRYVAWVEEEVRRRGIDTRYVPVSCRKDEIDPATQRTLDTSLYHWRAGGLDDYVAGWLEEPAKRHLSVLAEFGMGKSWFALHLAGRLAQGWREAKGRGVPRPRIPLLIPLRDYAKQTTVEGLLSEFFFNKHRINLRNYDVFRVLNRMGRLLLIFDGFDEMAARADRNTVVANFWELAKAVEPGAKVLLSSRKEHFRNAQEARNLFGAKVSASAAAVPANGPTFDIVELVRFDDEQIERMLRHDLAEDKIRLLMAHDGVRELMGRPVMTELVLDALPEIERGAEIDLARIYLYAVQRKMDRDVTAERTFTSRADKLFFLCEVAWEMLSTNRLSLNYRDFPDRLRSCFGSVVRHEKDLDYWEQDMRNQGMLVRDAEGDYGPSHKSLLEFLVAFKFAAELGLLAGDFLKALPAVLGGGRDRSWSEYFAARAEDGTLPSLGKLSAEPVETLARTFGALERNEAVYQFLATMVRERPDRRVRLLDLARQTAATDADTGLVAGNCLALLVDCGDDLWAARLAGVDLSGFLTAGRPGPVSLARADLRGARLAGANLQGVALSRADLTGAALGDGSLLEDGWQLSSGLLHPSGAVVTGGADGMLLWPDGRVDGAPVRPSTEGLGTYVSISQWDDERYWAFGEHGGRLFDATTGSPAGDVQAGQFHRPLRWRGRLVLGDADVAEGMLTLRDPTDGQVLVSIRFPNLKSSTSYAQCGTPAGIALLTNGRTHTRILVPSDGAEDGWEVLGATSHAPTVDVQHWLSSGDTQALVLDTRLVAAVDLTSLDFLLDGDGLPVPGSEWTAAEAVAYRSAAGLAALAADRRLIVWDTTEGDPQALWEIPEVPTGTQALWADPAGTRLAIVTRMGELWIRDFRTGVELSRTVLTDRLKGTRFSRTCGFGAETLAAIERVGGILVD
ncbi:pentapeptide repeat-containing protein [Streptomyces sp. NPDC089919]|uniref:NACHT domain-containing protein n=1 Tax=Streptomyces sp. NPDC089919 TaxID=3155188 RepID=UPI003431B503